LKTWIKNCRVDCIGTRIGLIIPVFIILAAVIFVYLFSTSILNYLFGPTNKIYVSGVSLEINNASPVLCFGNVIQPLPGFNTSKGKSFNYTFNLTDSCQESHNVTGVNVINSGFKTDVLSPRLPYQIFSNNKVPFKMVITPPDSFNGGILNLQVNVT